VATRLWLKEKLATLQQHCIAAVRVCLDRATNE
jgi:argininosuccinate lyase